MNATPRNVVSKAMSGQEKLEKFLDEYEQRELNKKKELERIEQEKREKLEHEENVLSKVNSSFENMIRSAMNIVNKKVRAKIGVYYGLNLDGLRKLSDDEIVTIGLPLFREDGGGEIASMSFTARKDGTVFAERNVNRKLPNGDYISSPMGLIFDITDDDFVSDLSILLTWCANGKKI